MSNEENLSNPDPETPDAEQNTENPAVEAFAESTPQAGKGEAGEPQPVVVHEQQDVVIRRAPKFSVFIILGIIVGVVIAGILTFGFPEVEGKTNWNQVFGFLFLPGIAIGAALGAVVALILDRRSRAKKRTGHAVAEHIEVRDETEEQ